MVNVVPKAHRADFSVTRHIIDQLILFYQADAASALPRT